MKNIISILFTLILLVGLQSNVYGQATSDRDFFEVQVDGLGCPFCAYGLEKKFKEFKGIKNIKIDMETGDFSFTFPNEKALGLKDVETQVDAAGYTAVTVKVTRSNGEVEVNEVSVSKNINADNVVKGTVFVEGTCKMCQARINKAVKSVEGVADANWDVKTKILSFSYDKTLTNTEAVEKAVATVGHDTRNISASDEVYENLPACCLYERIKKSN
jgi:periplasmic mercuric ion binding protein